MQKIGIILLKIGHAMLKIKHHAAKNRSCNAKIGIMLPNRSCNVKNRHYAARNRSCDEKNRCGERVSLAWSTA